MRIRVAAPSAERYVAAVRSALGNVLVLGLVVGAACAEPTWQDVVDDYADTICNAAYTCGSSLDVDECIAEVKVELADVRAATTTDAQARCRTCMETVTDVVSDVVERGCMSTAAQDARIYDACDLDPAVDFDRDGNPANDDTEACAGLP